MEGIDTDTVRSIHIFLYVVFIVFGSIVNIWLIVVILKSPELRSRYRNQIICNSLFANLPTTLLILPVWLAFMISRVWFRFSKHTCRILAFITHLDSIQDFVSNWCIFTLLLTLLAQCLEINQRLALNRQQLLIGRIVTLVLPWLFAVIFIPVMSFHNSHGIDDCMLFNSDARQVFYIVNNALPLGLATLVFGIIFVLRVKHANKSEVMHVRLQGGGQDHHDNIWPYMCLLTIATLSDIIVIIDNTSILPWTKTTFIIARLIGDLLVTIRVLIIAFGFLLFPDLWYHVKKSNPWLRSKTSTSTDITATFNRIEEA